ncbi:MAG: cation-efflux pump [Methylobacteriaceae bacterium]|jgi:cation diffusion facilitator family transporter|nr:cation-efflux pump [Methylobacteriaceae bacterium]
MSKNTVKNNAIAKERVALLSVAASTVITVAKGVTGVMTGSLALMSDAANSLCDIGMTAVTWLAIRGSNRPADESHHYGHGKIESLAALFETAFLFVVACAICFEGVLRLMSDDTRVSFSWLAVGALVLSIGVDFWRWRALRQTSRAVGGSEALEADAVHFASDMINSVLVLAALAAVSVGWKSADAAAALATAFFMFYAAFTLARNTVDTLIDAAPKGIAERLGKCAESVPGVVGVARARARSAGGRVFAAIEVKVSRTLPLEKVSDIKAQVTEVVLRDMPQADVEVMVEPVSLSNESIMERVMVIAARRKLFVHHVTVQELGGAMSIGFDLEIDGRLSILAAHRIATKLENAIHDEFGAHVEVDTHIEPLRVRSLTGTDEREAMVRSLSAALRQKAREVGEVSDIHSIRVRRSAEGLVINYHCRVDPHLTVNHVHAVIDELEWRFRLEHPDVIRVLGHSEPLRSEEAEGDAAAEEEEQQPAGR